MATKNATKKGGNAGTGAVKNGKKSFYREYIEPFLTALIIALVIRAIVIYPFRIPTGSMKDSLLIGDFLLANKFVYGIRSPDWIGIPYTEIGFRIPFFRTPGFRKPRQGDVVIFKYPRNPIQNYIKRCIATSGDIVEIRDKVVYVNGVVFENPPHSRFSGNHYPEDFQMPGIFPPGAGNTDYYGPVRVPAPGDVYVFEESNRDRWFEWMQVALYEGHRLKLTYGGKTVSLTEENLDKWPLAVRQYPVDSFSIDGQPLSGYRYTVRNRHYFLMGDNRDDSLDSRYWGFLPERYVVGEGLIIYWSWNASAPFHKKIRVNRILKLIH